MEVDDGPDEAWLVSDDSCSSRLELVDPRELDDCEETVSKELD